MAFDWSGGLQIAGGLMGLGQSSSMNAASRESLRNVAKINGTRSKTLDQMYGLAQNYNPEEEDQKTIDYAKDVSSDALTKSLSTLRGRYAPGDSEFRVSERDLAARALDPLRSTAATLASTRFNRKLGALSAVTSAGGDILSGYLQEAQASKSDPTGSILAISGGIDKLMGKGKDAKGNKTYQMT